MKTLSKEKSITVAIIMYIVVIISMIFIAAPIQARFGMFGLLLTELLFVTFAITGTLLLKEPLKEIFPLKMPKLRLIIGTFFLWLATYFIVLLVTNTVAYLFPEGFNMTTNSLSGFMIQVPLWVRFLMIAVTPAICEEMIHRGFILHFLKPIENKFLLILIMGCMFGIFHLSPYRFLPTAILGGILSYIMIETKNIFYPFLLHLINNSLSVFSTLLLENQEIAETVTTQAPSDIYNFTVVGSFLTISFVVPWFMWLGIKLIHEKNATCKLKTWQKVVICSFVSGICLIGGVSIITLSA